MGYGYYVIVTGAFGPASQGFESFVDAVNAAFSLVSQGLYAVVIPV